MTDQTPIEPSLAAPEADHAGAGPRLYGVVDVIRPNRVAGWVIDRMDSDAHADVVIRREGRVIARLPADRLRKDLQRGGVGTGNYGFSLPLEPPLEPGMEFTISVTARSRDGVEAPLQPAAKAARSGAPGQKLLERIFGELVEMRARIETVAASQEEHHISTCRMLERIEVVQARLEATLATAEAPASHPPRVLWVLAVAGLSLAAGSLALGVASLWVG